MITEKAEVIAVDGSYAVVQTQRHSTCDGCSANKGCGNALLSKLVGARFMRINVINKAGAKVGDTVQLGMQESGLLKSALLVYALPIVCIPLFIGVASIITQSMPSDGAAIVIALLGFGCGFVLARRISARLSENPKFHPVILAVEKPDAESSALPLM